MKVISQIQKGARRGVQRDVLATAGGFVASGLADRAAFSQLRGVFGDNSAEGGLSMQHKVARGAFRGAQVVAGGVMATKTQPIVRHAGVGLAAGGLWHLANQLGINF